jgi:outer membrane protein TolC
MINKSTLRISFLVIVQLLFFRAIAFGQEKGPVEIPPLTLSEKFDLAQKSKSANGSARQLTLDEAKDRALAGKGLSVHQLAAEAARQHRLAAQADYFPKIGSAFTNLHFNKFLGEEIRLLRRDIGIPLFGKDQTIAAVTVVQPITPIFQVREVVKIARADERIAQAKARMAKVDVIADVERSYFGLLVAHQQQLGAKLNIKVLENELQLATATTLSPSQLVELQALLLRANNTLLLFNNQVSELTQALNTLINLPAYTELELVEPPPSEDTISLTDMTMQALANNPEVIEAEQTVIKARAATKISKMNYFPGVFLIGGYSYQTAIPLLPKDFSFIGVVAAYNVFDFGKRERTVKESKAQLQMAEAVLEMVKSKVKASIQKSYIDLQRASGIRDLTRQMASMYRMNQANSHPNNPEMEMAKVKAEAEMYQAELDYRLVFAELQQLICKH